MHKSIGRWLLALPLAGLLLGATPSPAAADFSSFVFSFPCSLCSLSGTWVFNVPPNTTSARYSLFTFDTNGTVLVSESAGGEFHGVWTQVDTFRYSLSAVRQLGSGWQRIRVVIGHDNTCGRLKGTIKVDTLTCPNGANATCNPNQRGGSTSTQGAPGGWVPTPGTNADGSFDISATRYQRYPQSFLP